MAMTDMLYRLQELDCEEEKLRAKRDSTIGDPDYETAKEQLKVLEAELAAAKETLKAASREQHRLELDLKLTSARRTEVRGRMYDGTVTNMKELEKMTHMVEEMDAALSRLEDRILELMGRDEELEDAIDRLERELSEGHARFADLEQSRTRDLKTIDLQLATIPEQRAALLAEIPGDLVQRYENVRGRMGTRPLARVDRQICSGCRMSISATVMREVRKGDRIVQCESCGRILHWEAE